MNLLNTALLVTSSFEGGGFNNVVGNFDGQGLSAGALQWNFGQGTLQQLLKRWQQLYGDIKGFPTDINPLSDAKPSAAIDAASVMQGDDHVLLPAWGKAWRAFMGSPKMVQIQLEAAKPMGDYAGFFQRKWQLGSVAAYCWFFDTRVQNGSILIPKPEDTDVNTYMTVVSSAPWKCRKLWEMMVPTMEQCCLMKASWDRAMMSREEYKMDVFCRKATIVMGKGYVHDELVDITSLLEA